VDATDPQPGDQRPEGVKSGIRKVLIGLVILIVVAAIAVALSNLGGDDDGSGGGEQGLGPTEVTLGLAVGS
jgi:flagellar basal body-associated protein FliL